MEISCPVNHNYYEESPILDDGLAETFGLKKADLKRIREVFSSMHELTIGSEQLKHVRIVNFRKRKFEPEEDRLVIRLYSKVDDGSSRKYFIQTGLYAGVLYHRGCKFNITTKYGDVFLKRMLSVVNDIYIDNQKHAAKRSDKTNEFLYIIVYLFIQGLERASVLGIPQEYKELKERGSKIRGSVDLNSYLKNDIPFTGVLTYRFREQQYVQEIVDVLCATLRKLEQTFGQEIHNRILGLYQLLKQHYSGNYPVIETIQKAKSHQVLCNPLYAPFKKVLEYAELILLDKDLEVDNNEASNLQTTGYLFDIAELFELYLEKLLKRHLVDWRIDSQVALDVYKDRFYRRSMFPDLVLTHQHTYSKVVFDAKFKQMSMINSDVDRNDLYQVHSYISYFQNDIVAGGLLYPFSAEFSVQKSYSDNLFGNETNATNFIIDGVRVENDMEFSDLVQSEDQFITRISDRMAQVILPRSL